MADPIKGPPPLLPQIIRSVAQTVAKPIVQAVQQQAAQNGVRALQTGFEQQVRPLVNLAGGAVGAVVDSLRSIGINPGGRMHQVFGNTCGPNTLMAMEASVDAERAQELRETPAEDLAEREAAVMNSGAGGFTPSGNVSGGWNKWEMRSQIIDRFGAAEMLPAGRNYNDNAEAVADITRSLEEGRPVAMGMPGHWLAATEIRDGKNGQEVLIHDSWTGRSAWVPVSELEDPSGAWLQNHFPGAPEGANIQSIVVAGEPGEPAALNPDSANRAKERDTLDTQDVSDLTPRSDPLAPTAQ
jgi:hypothetical protein